jgi:hypothetical protein
LNSWTACMTLLARHGSASMSSTVAVIHSWDTEGYCTCWILAASKETGQDHWCSKMSWEVVDSGNFGVCVSRAPKCDFLNIFCSA